MSCHHANAGRDGEIVIERTFACPHSEDQILRAEEGRRLASRREDLIAHGADPAEIEVPTHPDDDPTTEGNV